MECMGTLRIMLAVDAPYFYIVERDATIVFASKPAREAPPPDVLDRMLQAAVAAVEAGDTRSPLMFEGWLVRSERLESAAGDARYMLFFENLATPSRDELPSGPR